MFVYFLLCNLQYHSKLNDMYECIHTWMQNVNILQLNWFEAESSWI